MRKIRSKWTMVFFKRTMLIVYIVYFNIPKVWWLTRILLVPKFLLIFKISFSNFLNVYALSTNFWNISPGLKNLLRSFASRCCVFRPKFISSSENSVIVSGMVGSSSSFFDGDDDGIKVFTAFPGWPADNKVFALSEVSSSRIDYTGSKLDKRNYRNRYSLERHSVKQPAPNDGYIWWS